MAAVETIPVPRIEEFMRRAENILVRLEKLSRMTFAWGTQATATKGWVKIFFVDPLTGKPVQIKNPSVVAVFKERRGTWTPPRYMPPQIKIRFPKPSLKSVPVPSVAVPSLPFPSVSVPHISIPSVSVPRITVPSVSVARVRRGNFATESGKKAKEWFKAKMGDWGWANWIRDRLADLMYWVGYGVGLVMNWVWDKFIQPQIDKVQDTINYGLSLARSRVQSALDGFRNSVNYALSYARSSTQNAVNYVVDRINKGFAATRTAVLDLRSKANAALSSLARNAETALNRSINETNTALSELSSGAEKEVNKGFSVVAAYAGDAVNQALEKLYELIGLVKGEAFTPVTVRNVTDSYFEVWSPGEAVVTWIAVGERP